METLFDRRYTTRPYPRSTRPARPTNLHMILSREHRARRTLASTLYDSQAHTRCTHGHFKAHALTTYHIHVKIRIDWICCLPSLWFKDTRFRRFPCRTRFQPCQGKHLFIREDDDRMTRLWDMRTNRFMRAHPWTWMSPQAVSLAYWVSILHRAFRKESKGCKTMALGRHQIPPHVGLHLLYRPCPRSRPPSELTPSIKGGSLI